jgi:hypothetical protein
MKLSWSAIVTGWLSTVMLSLIGSYLVVGLASANYLRSFQGMEVASIATLVLMTLIGGFIASRIAPDWPILHGLVLGVLTLGFEIGLRILIVGLNLSYLPLTWLLIVPGAMLGSWLGRRRQSAGDLAPAYVPPVWLTGALKGIGGFVLVAGILVIGSLNNESGFIYINGGTVMGFITQVVLILGYLVTSLLRAVGMELDTPQEIVFILLISSLPWAVFGALRATGQKRLARTVAIITVLFSLIPGLLIYLIVRGLSEGPR